MTTLTVDAKAPRQRGHYRDAVTAEVTKFRSVRSTYWSLAAAAVLTVGLAAIIGFAISNAWTEMAAAERAGFNAVEPSLVGLWLGQLAIGTLGILAITSEYATGLIRTTLAAVPRRRTLLMAKATVVGAVSLAVGTALSLASFGIAQVFLSRRDIQASLGDPGVARVVFGGGLFIAVIALVGLALGTVIRHTAGTVVSLVGLVFLLPNVLDSLPRQWSGIRDWTVSAAGEGLMNLHSDPQILPPGRALFVAFLWVAGSLAIAAFAISRRDA
jgi:ABC-2 type transport system permease protein